MIEVFAIVGKSGAGKDYLLQKVVSMEPTIFNEIISCTTRPKRENETDGVNYHFISTDDFIYKKNHGEMLEVSYFRDWWYGTSLDSLIEDKINIGVCNPTGIISLSKNSNINLTVFYLDTEDKERLMRQLTRETNPDTDEIVRRYITDERDFLEFQFTEGESNYYLNNDTVDELVDNLALIIDCGRRQLKDKSH